MNELGWVTDGPCQLNNLPDQVLVTNYLALCYLLPRLERGIWPNFLIWLIVIGWNYPISIYVKLTYLFKETTEEMNELFDVSDWLALPA